MKRSSISIVCVHAALLGAVGAASAQGSDSRRSTLLEEVIVTAQKREESAQNVGIAIAVFSGQKLDSLGVKDTTDLSALVPGFTYTNSSFSIPIYTLRGVGFNEHSQTATPAVAVYVDEIGLPFAVMTKGTNLDIERVEVLKGPQGTLYGRNTTGGAVSYIANKPSETFEAYFKGTVSSYKSTDAEISIGGPLSDTLGWRLAYRNIRSREGWQYDYTRDGAELGEVDKQSARATLAWDPTDVLSINLTLDGWTDDSEPQSPQYFHSLPFSPFPGTEPSQEFQDHPTAPDNARATAFNPGRELRLDQEHVGGALHVTWQVLDSVTYHGLYGTQRYAGQDSFNADGVNVRITDYDTDADIDAWSTEQRFSGLLFDDFVEWTAGYFKSHDKLSDVRTILIEDSSIGVLFKRSRQNAAQEAESEAIFGQLGWLMSDAFKLTAGLRYTKDTRDYVACTRDIDGDLARFFKVLAITNNPDAALDDGPNQGDCVTIDSETGRTGPVAKSLDEENTAGKIGLDWMPGDDLLLYTSYSIGYKAGSFPNLSSANSDQYDPVTQEKVDAYEIGFKGSWFDRLLQVNAAVFYYDYEDKHLLTYTIDPVFGPALGLDNVPLSVVQGAELDVQGAPFAGFYASLAATYLDTRIKEFTGFDVEGNVLDLSGNELDNSPPLEVTLLLNYEFDIGDATTVFLGADGNYSDRAYGDLVNDKLRERPSYWQANARVGIKSFDESWKVTAFARNVTDEYYVTSPFASIQTVAFYSSMPRTYGLTFEYRIE